MRKVKMVATNRITSTAGGGDGLLCFVYIVVNSAVPPETRYRQAYITGKGA